jgi:hypothetical protein
MMRLRRPNTAHLSCSPMELADVYVDYTNKGKNIQLFPGIKALQSLRIAGTKPTLKQTSTERHFQP